MSSSRATSDDKTRDKDYAGFASQRGRECSWKEVHWSVSAIVCLCVYWVACLRA